MTKKQIPPCRLYILIARNAPKATIFRRGPSSLTQLILWKTNSDEFVYGQWFKGRIYERRCDLSPDGTKLLYFVSKINRRTIEDREYTYAWSAVSKPPYLTALALWPKGDCWHGGGLFEDDSTVLLNHKPEVAIPHPNHLPENLIVNPNPNASGENDPLFGMRLDRDGWALKQKLDASWKGITLGFTTEQPEIRVRAHLSNKYSIVLTRRLDGLKDQELFKVIDKSGNSCVDVGQANWVDWDQEGRLVILKKGKLLVGEEIRANSSWQIKELADFNSQTFEPIIAPSWAEQW